MARCPRMAFEGAIYHVTFRGNGRRAIFLDDGDRTRFLEELAHGVADYGIRLYLWCLMTNHVHLLLETPRGNISAFMGALLTAYSGFFNRRHRRSGHLTQGRFHSPLVEGDRYLLKLGRYIHLNPVQVKGWRERPLDERIARLRSYPWSSYRGYIGACRPEPFVEQAPLLAMRAGPAKGRRTQYGAYVEAGLAESDAELLEAMRCPGLGIGSPAFLRDLRTRHGRESLERVKTEDVAFRRGRRSVEPQAVVDAVCAHFGVGGEVLFRHERRAMVKPVLASLLVRHAGLTQREAAVRLGLTTGAAVSMQLRKLRADQGKDLRRAVQEIERGFNL